MLIGQGDLGQVWAFLSREERVAECKEEKLSEEGRIFSLWWVSGSYAEWPSLFWFNVDVQWVSGGPAEWSSPFSIVQCLMFKGSQVVSRMAILFFRSMSNVQDVGQSCRMVTSLFFYRSILMPSQSPLLLPC